MGQGSPSSTRRNSEATASTWVMSHVTDS
jgi:hypothetical protein